MLDVEKRMAEFENQISQAQDIKEKLKNYRFYALYMSQIDPKKSYEIIEEGIKCSLETDDEFEQQWMSFLKGICLVELDKYDLALSILLGVKNYFFIVNEKEFYAKTLSNIAVVYFNLQRYNQAIFIWKDLLINYIQHDDYTFKNLVMNNLIAAYQNTFFFNEFSEIQIKEILDYYHINNVKKDQTYCDALVNLATHYRLKSNYKKAIEIGTESLHLANLENYNKLKCEISYILYLCYNELQDDVNSIYHLKMALSSSKKFHFTFLHEELYKALYLYYKQKESYQEAFEYLEKYHEVEKIKREAQSNINWIVEKFGFEENDQKNAGYLKEYIRKNTFDLDRNIFMENTDGEVVKVNVDSIVYIESYNKNLKIFFPNNRTETFRKSFKEFTDFIQEKFQSNHLFFYTNLRNQMVNLYWISRFDRASKQLYLNVIGQEIMFEVSRSQISELKDFLAKK